MTHSNTAEPAESADRTPGVSHDHPGGDVVVPETAVPAGETPALCPYCDRPFRGERVGALHVGQVHEAECSPAEREAYDAALDEEGDDLFVYHLRVVAALSLTYTVAVLGYMVVLGAG